jgi:serine/arginine repetitive matrix protein 2
MKPAPLHYVTSATDRLVDLVTHFEPSPSSTPGIKTIAQGISPALAEMASNSSMSASVHASPTPMRRTRSALLTNRLTVKASPLKNGNNNVSPLKAALARAITIANSPAQQIRPPPRTSPMKTSLVQAGMRNIFAPPSPPASPIQTKVSTSSAKKVVDEKVGMSQTMGPEVVEQRKMIASEDHAMGMPIDLFALIMDEAEDDDDSAASPTQELASRSHLGLPAPPAKDRISPRRPARAAPAISLPPLPDMPAHLAPGGYGAFDDVVESESGDDNDMLFRLYWRVCQSRSW